MLWYSYARLTNICMTLEVVTLSPFSCPSFFFFISCFWNRTVKEQVSLRWHAQKMSLKAYGNWRSLPGADTEKRRGFWGAAWDVSAWAAEAGWTPSDWTLSHPCQTEPLSALPQRQAPPKFCDTRLLLVPEMHLLGPPCRQGRPLVLVSEPSDSGQCACGFPPLLDSATCVWPTVRLLRSVH